MTQQQLAGRLSLTPSQVSHYELNPQNVPVMLLLRWLQACGADQDLRTESINLMISQGLDVGDPYSSIRRRLTLLARELEAERPTPIPKELGKSVPDPNEFVASLKTWKLKPNVLIAGRFDAGKSRLANYFLGSNDLPCHYQPTTGLVTYIRHVEDRPSWQREEVWIMGDAFNPFKWDDEQHCTASKIVAGSFDTLRAYCDAGGNHETQTGGGEAQSALVYMDAQVLLACNLIDLPGYGDNDLQERLLSFSGYLPGFLDILIYLAPAKGFLDTLDFHHLSSLLAALPAPEDVDPGFPRYANLFIVASQADPSVKDDLPAILERGSKRLADHVKRLSHGEHRYEHEYFATGSSAFGSKTPTCALSWTKL